MSRAWESIISYENRGEGFHTSRWRLGGVATKEGAENTDGGVLWLAMTRDGGTVTAELFKDAARAADAKVATGTADTSGLDGTAEAAVEVALTEANASGLSGAFFVHRFVADGACPVQVALCVDEDLDTLWDGIEALPGYDDTAGCAEFIRLACQDVLARTAAMFRDTLGGHASAAAWFIADAGRSLPDLRRIANPAQLRVAAAHRALEIALGRCHRSGAETMYSRLRDYHHGEWERAMASLVLAVRGGEGDVAASPSGSAVRQVRV